MLWWLPEHPPNPGGIGTFAVEIGAELRDAGEDLVRLVGWGESSDEIVDGVRVIREPIRAAFESRDARTILRIRRRVGELKRELDPDLYHVHLCEPSPVLHLTSGGRSDAPTVITIHNEMIRELVRSESSNDSLINRLLDDAAVVVNCSAGAHRANADAAPSRRHEMVAIPNGVACGQDPAPVPDDPLIIAVGRLTHQKAFDRVIRAMPRVLAAVPLARLRILGDGPDRDDLQRLVDDLGVADSVSLVGHVDHARMSDEYGAARVVVAPSRHEGLPYALLEAASAGRAIVASRIAGVADIVIDGENGVTVDESELDHDVSRLADAIVSVIEESGSAAEFGAAARRHVSTTLSARRCAERYQQVYDAVTAPHVDVAVIIPAWNAERHLRQTLDSILADFDATPSVSYRVMVVVDGATDSTEDIVRSYGDRGVEIFTQPNLGIGAARNAGIALTRSEFLAHFDSDDLWPAGRISALLAAFSDDVDDEIDGVFGYADEFADADAPANALVNTESTPVRMPTTGLLRRSAHDRYGGFDLVRASDQVGWASLALANGLRSRMIDHPTLHRRVHATNNSHLRPFTDDRTRVVLMKRALDAKRRRANAD